MSNTATQINQLPLVVITGASSGIGARVAQDYFKLGHPLLLLSRRVEMMKSLNLPNSLCLSVTVTDLEQI
ncbi:hypothetical protein TrLO_g2936 [Triparma laevis f. longispina]|uniref:Uncharacterized protein n=1 Tax=Triparma laevis f. longispina TaxID=1714387 RepID=A0A9W7FI15_9STRA|nr:hypothetical protein TrLO_g2936 [Triparma laevis f. longispina]